MDRPASSGGDGKYMIYVTFPWPCLRSHCQFLTLAISSSNQPFEKELKKANEVVFSKLLSWKDPFGSSVDHDVTNKPYRIKMPEE